MKKDITKWITACLTYATRQPERTTKSPLTPIPVGGVFDRVGVNIKFPTSYDGNQYAVVFMVTSRSGQKYSQLQIGQHTLWQLS